MGVEVNNEVNMTRTPSSSAADSARARAFKGKFFHKTIGLGMPIVDYMMYRRENPEGSKTYAVTRAIGNFVLWEFAPEIMWAWTLKDVFKAGGEALGRWYFNNKIMNQRYYHSNLGGVFKDSQTKATLRQRGLAAIQTSRVNARTVLGNEAKLLGQMGINPYM